MADEDFDIASLADFLHLTPPVVRKMAERDKIPGRRVGGQWRFSRAEIHSWFEAKIGLSDHKELVEVEKILEIQSSKTEVESFHIPNLLLIENVFVPLLAKTKTKVIQSLCDQMADTGQLWDANKMADAIRNREELHPTALENGVALLHPRRPMVKIIGHPFLAIGITSSGIPFGGPRGVLTDIFFLICSNNEAVHLRVLARLSRLICQESFLSELRESDSPDTAWKIIEQFDSELD